MLSQRRKRLFARKHDELYRAERKSGADKPRHLDISRIRIALHNCQRIEFEPFSAIAFLVDIFEEAGDFGVVLEGRSAEGGLTAAGDEMCKTGFMSISAALRAVICGPVCRCQRIERFCLTKVAHGFVAVCCVSCRIGD